MSHLWTKDHFQDVILATTAPFWWRHTCEPRTILKTPHLQTEDHFEDVILVNQRPFWRCHTCEPRTILKTSYLQTQYHFEDVTLANQWPLWRRHTRDPRTIFHGHTHERTILKTSYLQTEDNFEDVILPPRDHWRPLRRSGRTYPRLERAVSCGRRASVGLARDDTAPTDVPLGLPYAAPASSRASGSYLRSDATLRSAIARRCVDRGWCYRTPCLSRLSEMQSQSQKCFLFVYISLTYKYGAIQIQHFYRRHMRDTVARQHCWIQYFSCLKFRSCLTTMSNIMIMLQSGATV